MTRNDIKTKLLENLKDIIANDSTDTTQMSNLVDTVRELITQNTPLTEQTLYHKYVFEIVNEWQRSGIVY